MSRDINALLKAMNYQTKKIEAIYYKLALNFKMSESEFWILYTLSGAEQECSQQEISEELSVSKQTINSAIQSLVQRKYIFLELSPVSARRKNVRITEKRKTICGRKYCTFARGRTRSISENGQFCSEPICYPVTGICSEFAGRN